MINKKIIEIKKIRKSKVFEKLKKILTVYCLVYFPFVFQYIKCVYQEKESTYNFHKTGNEQGILKRFEIHEITITCSTIRTTVT